MRTIHWDVIAMNWGAIALCVLFWAYVFALFFGEAR